MIATRLALSIRQPWAWLILHSGKDVENRTWRTNFRGRILIHAAKGITRREYEAAQRFNDFVAGSPSQMPAMSDLPRGGIVGEVEIVDCQQCSRSIWHDAGAWGFILRDPRPLPFQPCKGRLGIFKLEGLT